MARYTADSKERVRDAVDMVDLVSSRTELRRAGADRYSGLCPFHDERTPSFSVRPSLKVYYCFGCQAKGDAFSFVQETEQVDFTTAMELLADRYKVTLEREAEDPGEVARRERRERLMALLERTCTYYERYLWDAKEGAKARDYLLGRGLSEEMLRDFRVGYAPSAWDRVLMASRQGGFSEEELIATGLAQRSRERPGSIYDRFRARITFPLCDLRGRVLGFGARALSSEKGPKYLNTAENDLYHKGRHVFGAHLARAAAAKAASVVVCEGYTDVIAMHQAGLRNTVGLMGTALTDEQLAELGRLAPTVALALDADGAGLEAMLRAARQAERSRIDLRVIPLPPGSDPADLLLRDGPQALEALAGSSISLVRFRVERALAAGELGSAEGRDRALADLRGVLAGLGAGAQRMELEQLIASRLELPERTVASLLAGGPAAGGGGAGGGGRRAATTTLDARERTERSFLALCIAMPERGAQALAMLDPETHFASELTRRAAVHLRTHLDSPTAGVDDGELAALLAELAVRGSEEPVHPAQLDAERWQLELARIDRAIVAGRAAGAGGLTELGDERMKAKAAAEAALAAVLESTASPRE